MSVLTEAIYDVLAGDETIVSLIGTYGGLPAVFTIDPAPGDAVLPYIVTAGSVAQESWDTKTTRGRIITRDIRCYTAASGSSQVVENIAERVRELFHRQELEIDGYSCIILSCSGPQAADEQEAYGRIVTLRVHVLVIGGD